MPTVNDVSNRVTQLSSTTPAKPRPTVPATPMAPKQGWVGKARDDIEREQLDVRLKQLYFNEPLNERFIAEHVISRAIDAGVADSTTRAAFRDWVRLHGNVETLITEVQRVLGEKRTKAATALNEALSTVKDAGPKAQTSLRRALETPLKLAAAAQLEAELNKQNDLEKSIAAEIDREHPELWGEFDKRTKLINAHPLSAKVAEGRKIAEAKFEKTFGVPLTLAGLPVLRRAAELAKVDAIRMYLRVAPAGVLAMDEKSLLSVWNRAKLLPAGEDSFALELPAPNGSSSAGIRLLRPLTTAPSNAEAIVQGQIGNCYLPGTIAALIKTDPQFFNKVMKENADGTVTVSFYRRDPLTQNIERFPVTIAKKVWSGGAGIAPPINEDGVTADEDARFALLETAYAKAFGKGSIEGIESGYPADVIAHLTGKGSTVLLLEPTEVEGDTRWRKSQLETNNFVERRFLQPKTADKKATADAVWSALKQAVATKRAAVVSTSPNIKNASQAGLVGPHAYSVANVTEHDGKRTVELRNPWGPTLFVPLEHLLGYIRRVTIQDRAASETGLKPFEDGPR